MQFGRIRGAAEENALAKLSRATRSVIFASTTKEQFAAEFTELKHGAFTYVLINALSGKASLANGQITVSSIKAFVDDQIPAMTKKYKGEEQFPTTFIWGQDFLTSNRKRVIKKDKNVFKNIKNLDFNLKIN